jgi:hypothetical protein
MGNFLGRFPVFPSPDLPLSKKMTQILPVVSTRFRVLIVAKRPSWDFGFYLSHGVKSRQLNFLGVLNDHHP